MAMSFAALGLVPGHVVVFGAVSEADEGTAAVIWQILMAAQVPVVAFFANQVVTAESTTGAAGIGAASRRRARSTCPGFLFQPLNTDSVFEEFVQ